MILDRKHFSFLEEVIDRGNFNAIGGYAEGRVLNSLEFLNKNGEVLGNQMTTAYMKRDRIKDI